MLILIFWRIIRTFRKEYGIYEISGPLFFGSAKQYCEVLKSTGFSNKVLIIRMRHVPFMDSTGINNFREALKILNSSGIKIVLSGVNPELRKELDRCRISFLVGKANIYAMFAQALERAGDLVKVN